MTDRLEPSLHKVVCRMRDPRGVVLKKFFRLHGGVCVESALPSPKRQAQREAASDARADSSATAAFGGVDRDLSHALWEVWERTNLIRQFTALFGCTDERTDESAALVMAYFPRTTGVRRQANYRKAIPSSNLLIAKPSSRRDRPTPSSTSPTSMDSARRWPIWRLRLTS